MANSFYGGLNGQPFDIKRVFPTRVAMELDASQGWVSDIAVGEFVAVYYGLPHDGESYTTKRATDLAAFDNKSYNSTLWQKMYDESQSSINNGIYYRQIGRTMGDMPVVSVSRELEQPDYSPTVRLGNPDQIDAPELVFTLPRPWEMFLNVLTPESDCQLEVVTVSGNKYQRLSLPKAWKFDILVNRIAANLPPSATLEKGKKVVVEDEVASLVDDPDWATYLFEIPVAERVSVEFHKITADQNPRYQYDNTTDPNNPILKLWLPQAWNFEVSKQELPPLETPQVSISQAVSGEDDTATSLKTILFKLPRAVRFYHGDAVDGTGTHIAVPLADVSSDMKIGDFYINDDNGYIFQSVEVDDTHMYFDFWACLMAPNPEVDDDAYISPYEEDGQGGYKPALPTAVLIPPTGTSKQWGLKFGLPTAPTPLLDFDLIGPDDTESADLAIFNEDSVQFALRIPRGTKIFSGTQIDGDHLTRRITGAKNGDIYLNTSPDGEFSGLVYRWREDAATWELDGGTLKGPKGELHILGPGNIYGVAGAGSTDPNNWGDGIADTEAAIGAVLATRYPDIKDNELVAINYYVSDNDVVAYWFYGKKVGATITWTRQQLSGGAGSLIADSYTTESTKAYNAPYVNNLINDDEDDRPTRTAYNKQTTDEKIAALINDDNQSDESTYSSEKIEDMVANSATKWGKFSDLERVPASP